MRSALLLLAALSLSACGKNMTLFTDGDNIPDPTPKALVTTEAASNCDLHVEKAWIDGQAPADRYIAEAITSGPTCATAVATLVVRAGEGAPLYVWASPAQDIFGLKDAPDTTAMKVALKDWIDQGNSSIKTTADLPDWSTTEGQAKRAEFPFMPEEGMDAKTYEDLRKQKLDVFCFPQGGESLACAALQDGQMQSIGLQLFPG
jgi:hypothetical protein